MTRNSRTALADLTADPALAAEVDLDDIPELLGEMERLRAILWARLALRISRPDPGEDRLLVAAEPLPASAYPRAGSTAAATGFPSPYGCRRERCATAPRPSIGGSPAASARAAGNGGHVPRPRLTGAGPRFKGCRMIEFTLAADGDANEQQWTTSESSKLFPCYEDFWREHVVPLTFRPLNRDNIFMRPSVPSHLRALGTSHYWVFYNFARAGEVLGADRFPSVGRLYDFYAHLASVSSSNNSMLASFLDAAREVLAHYGGKPRGTKKDRLAGYPKGTVKRLKSADKHVDRYRNWLQHNGGLPLIEGRIPRKPRKAGYDLGTIADLLDSPTRAADLASRFVDARVQARTCLEAVAGALNEVWRTVLADFAGMKDRYRSEQAHLTERDRRLASHPDLLRRKTAPTTTFGVVSASPECLTHSGVMPVITEHVNTQSHRS